MSRKERKRNIQTSTGNPQCFNQSQQGQYQFVPQLINPFQPSQQRANQQPVANPFQPSQQQVNQGQLTVIPVPFPFPAAYNLIDPVQIGITQEQCKEGIQRLENAESRQTNGLEKMKKLKEMVRTLNSDQVLEQGIQDMLQIIKEIEDDSEISVDDTKESKKLFTKIVSACNYLHEHKEYLAQEIESLKSDIDTLGHELENHKKRTETSENKVVELKKEIENVKTQANNQINALEEKISKLNEQLTQSQEEKAKSVICQVMTVVPTLMVKRVFPRNDRYKKVYSFSELENMVNRLSDVNEAEKSAKQAMLDKLTTKLGCTKKDMEEFIQNFKENCVGCRPSQTSELNKKVIEESILILLKENIIDESDEQKCIKLAKLWEECYIDVNSRNGV